MASAQLTNSALIDQLTTQAQQQFTGRLDIAAPNRLWSLFYCIGRLVWATSSYHSNRRFYRLIQQFGFETALADLKLRNESFGPSQHYHLLMVMTRRQRITPEQSIVMVNTMIKEILFDIFQYEAAAPLTFSTYPDRAIEKANTLMHALIRPQQVLTVALQLWQDWQESGLTAYSPNHAPVLRQPDILKQQISSKAFATLSKVVNGQRTLRDVAVLMRQDILRLGRSLLPLIEQQLVQLIEVGDREGTTPTIQAQPEAPKPLIACIDDSPQVCQTMQTIVESAGYRFIGIQDSIRAVPVLLQNKPDLIFLDLVMPVAYGYEICTQIRRVATFRTIPVIILTGNDGVVDRLRAKMVGATDFLTKPVEKDKVISTIHQFCTAPQPNSR